MMVSYTWSPRHVFKAWYLIKKRYTSIIDSEYLHKRSFSHELADAEESYSQLNSKMQLTVGYYCSVPSVPKHTVSQRAFTWTLQHIFCKSTSFVPEITSRLPADEWRGTYMLQCTGRIQSRSATTCTSRSNFTNFPKYTPGTKTDI
jgi:hypothetical protein